MEMARRGAAEEEGFRGLRRMEWARTRIAALAAMDELEVLGLGFKLGGWR